MVTESGEAEFLLPFPPSFAEAMFVDGLPDIPDASCAIQQPDKVFAHIKCVGLFHRKRYYLAVRWVISKPRKIWWKATK